MFFYVYFYKNRIFLHYFLASARTLCYNKGRKGGCAMLGFRLTPPRELPCTVWACKTNVNDYDWQNRNTADMIELSITTADTRYYRSDEGAERILRGTTLTCVVGDTTLFSRADTGVEVCITSVALRFPSLCYEQKELEEGDFADPTVLLLPLITEDLPQRDLADISRMLHRYIHASTQKTAAANATCASLALALLARMDAIARRVAGKRTGQFAGYYIGKVDAILRHRYAEKLSLAEIAAELEITPSYLSALYKRHTGMGFAERLFEIRMEKARELLQGGARSVAEIAQAVGIPDESHLRRRFKEYFGTGIGAYRHIQKEQTLYHARPVRPKKKETDA